MTGRNRTRAIVLRARAILTINEARQKQLGCSSKPDYFLCTATVVRIRSDRATYRACPTAHCIKKVSVQSNGKFRCSKCNCEYPDFRHCLLLNVKVSDHTGSQWVTAFQGVAEKLLGVTAAEVGEAGEGGDEKRLHSIFTRATFKSYTFLLRARMDNHLVDERHLSITAIEAKPIRFVDRNKYLLGQIKKGQATLQAKS